MAHRRGVEEQRVHDLVRRVLRKWADEQDGRVQIEEDVKLELSARKATGRTDETAS